MDLTLSIRADEGLLYATYSGKFFLTEAERTFLQIVSVLKRHTIQKVVVDGRGITGDVSTIERFLYGEFVADAVITRLKRAKGHAPKFAYVLTPPVLDPQRLGESVAVSRGMVVKAFDNLNDALEWLGIDSSKDGA